MASTAARGIRGSLGIKAASAAADCFQGRHEEINRFVDLLGRPESLPHYLYVTGPVGVGKTALIGAVRRRMAAEPVGDVVVIDAAEFDGDPASFEHLVRSRAAPWPRTAADAPVVIFIDGFERVGREDRHRLGRTFISSLTGPVVLAVCERQLPGELLIESAGWRSIIEEMPIELLSREQEFRLLSAQGLSASDSEALASVTRGNPLLIAVAGTAKASPADRDRRIAQQTTRLLFSRLQSEGVDDATRALIEVVALFPCLNEEALEAAVGSGLRRHFDRFAALSIVQTCPAGFVIDEPFRSLLALDLRSRRPGWCEDMERAVASPSQGERGVDVQSDLTAASFHSAPVCGLSVSPEEILVAKEALESLRQERFGARRSLPAGSQHAAAETIEDVRARLSGIIHSLCESHSPRVAEAGCLLSNYHLNGSPSLEAVAQTMHLSRATIFRRLRFGIELVAERLSASATTVETVPSGSHAPACRASGTACRPTDRGLQSGRRSA